jgi:hypothetical protein
LTRACTVDDAKKFGPGDQFMALDVDSGELIRGVILKLFVEPIHDNRDHVLILEFNETWTSMTIAGDEVPGEWVRSNHKLCRVPSLSMLEVIEEEPDTLRLINSRRDQVLFFFKPDSLGFVPKATLDCPRCRGSVMLRGHGATAANFCPHKITRYSVVPHNFPPAVPSVVAKNR